MNDAKPLILTSPEEIARLLQPHLEALVNELANKANSRAGNPGRLLPYKEAMQYLGMKPTMFSTLVGRGDIPHVPVGRTKKFRVADLDKFQGYDPKAEKQRVFAQDLENILARSRRRKKI